MECKDQTIWVMFVQDAVYPPEKLDEMVSQCDYVVMATPLTPQTEKLMSASAIDSMKATAVFVNIGRGKCVDEPALIAALRERRIRGAALDVFFTEPLPADNELWGLDNVLISPHTADRTKVRSWGEPLKFVGLSLCH